MPRVFISYRRAHVPFEAAILHAKLAQKFGKTRVFLDTATIPGGADFERKIETEIRACSVVLLMLHDGWAGDVDESGRRRLERPTDYVLRELQLATRYDKRIVPVLVGAGQMPRPEELPPSLAHIVKLNAVPLRAGTDLNRDVEHIARIIDPFPRKRRIIIAALLGLATLAAWMWMTREDMVTVGAGPFVMGCNRAVDDECGSNEQDAHTVDVPRFRIDRTEVTVAQYQKCVAAGACSDDGLTMPFWNGREQPERRDYCNWGAEERRSHPINCLSWDQARAYCAWLGKRLPREEEWEKAARGANGRKYPWGDDGYAKVASHVANVADETANWQFPAEWKTEGGFALGYDDGYAGTAPADSFPAGASPYGALNMVGNVWEWVDGETETGKVARGGSWYDRPMLARASSRDSVDATDRLSILGMRCAR